MAKGLDSQQLRITDNLELFCNSMSRPVFGEGEESSSASEEGLDKQEGLDGSTKAPVVSESEEIQLKAGRDQTCSQTSSKP